MILFILLFYFCHFSLDKMNQTTLSLLTKLRNDWKNNTQPRNILQLQYDSANRSNAPTLNVISSSDIPKQYYSIIMVDPDAPTASNPIYADFIHWIRVNMNIVGGKLVGGEDLLEYMGPSPPKGSGSHHYITLLIQHDKNSLVNVELSGRAKQNTSDILRQIFGSDVYRVVGFNVFTYEL